MATISYLMSNGIILLKSPYISFIITTGVWNVKTTYRKSRAGNLFQWLTLTFDPFFSVKWGNLTTKALYLPQCSYFTDPKVGDNYCSSGLVFSLYVIREVSYYNKVRGKILPLVVNITYIIM